MLFANGSSTSKQATKWLLYLCLSAIVILCCLTATANSDLLPLSHGDFEDSVELAEEEEAAAVAAASGTEKVQTLHIGGLFPMRGTGGWIGGPSCLPAARMALEDVNKRKDLLPGYKLILHANDSQCNPGLGAFHMYDMIYRPPTKVILVCGCSTVCSIVAESANMWNLIVVGYGSSSPALSERSRFPTFFRTHPPATIHNPTRIALFEKYGWSRVAIILETEEVFIETARDLEQECRKKNITVLTRVSFVRNPSDAMENLKRADPRVIIGMFYKQQARRVMCTAYKIGLYGEKYVWFLIGWYEDNWWTESDCKYEHMKEAVEGHITTEGLLLNKNDNETVSGYTSSAWLSRYQAELSRLASYQNQTSTLLQGLPTLPAYGNQSSGYSKNHHHQHQQQQQHLLGAINTSVEGGSPAVELARQEGYQEAPLAYDAIWAIAFALNDTIRDLAHRNLSISQFNYTQTPEIKNVFLDNLSKTKFTGISGEVAFTGAGDRIAKTQIEQMVDGVYHVIGYYDSRTGKLDLNETLIRWPRGEPPKDRTIIKEMIQYLSLPYMISIFIISIIGILISIGLIYFNWSCREDALIKMSHPPSNNIMLLGCIVCLVSVVLFGLDGRFIPDGKFHLICNLRALCLNTGFSLFFGSMFWKVWQSYVLSTRNAPPFGKTNHQVFTTVGSFCLIDLLILAIWIFKEPMDRTTVKIKEQPGPELNMGDDVIVELKIEYCQANFYWYYLIFCYKGLLLVFGLFLAYETRSVKLRQLNDSKLVGMCIYNVAILCFITGPVSLVNLMRQQVNYHYLFVSITILFCCSLSMILIFLPKVVEYLRRKKRRAGGGAAGGPGSSVIQDERSSRDDEEQLNKLERENRELAEKIREKDSQMKAMIARIEEARENANKSLADESASAAAVVAATTTTTTTTTTNGTNTNKQTLAQTSCLRGRRGIQT